MAKDINIVYASHLKEPLPPLHDGIAYCPSQQCHQGLVLEANPISDNFQIVRLWCLPDMWCKYRNHPDVRRTGSLSWLECLKAYYQPPADPFWPVSVFVWIAIITLGSSGIIGIPCSGYIRISSIKLFLRCCFPKVPQFFRRRRHDFPRLHHRHGVAEQMDVFRIMGR